ncbi:MAG: hypothetical protein JSR18_15250 [Proteobacteria bacterium]|nr:hypothetical protein [Pseudomonadota bacterium]
MNDPQKIDAVVSQVEPGRRDAVRKILLGTALYAAPIVASFSMDSLGGVANAQVISGNQTSVPVQVPATTGVGLFSIVAALGAAGALMLRRIRGR